jgi:hypothetical protein
MYTTQGYPAAEVMKQLVPAQLLPSVFEAIALYGGITVVLIAAAIINEKVTRCLVCLNDQSECCEAVQGSSLSENKGEETINTFNEKIKEPAVQPEAE